MDLKTFEKLFPDQDIPTDQLGRIERAKDLLIHALGGCRPVPLCVFDPTSERMLEVGLICPVCLRYCAYPEGPVQ